MRYVLKVICAFVILMLGACTNNLADAADCDPSLPQPNKWVDPAYPNARIISQDEVVGKSYGKMVFETGDDPAQVVAYYQDVLTRARWHSDSSGAGATNAPAKTSLYLIIGNCCSYGWVKVTTTPLPGGTTQATIEHGWDNMGCG